MHWTPHLTVAAVIERDGRYLLVEERVKGLLTLNQPAGHVEDGESLIEAVVREVREETAWEFAPESLVGIYRWRRSGPTDTFFRFCFAGRLIQHCTNAALDPDIIRTLWLTGAELDAEAARHRSPLVGRCMADYLAGRRYPLDLLQEVDLA